MFVAAEGGGSAEAAGGGTVAARAGASCRGAAGVRAGVVAAARATLGALVPAARVVVGGSGRSTARAGLAAGAAALPGDADGAEGTGDELAATAPACRSSIAARAVDVAGAGGGRGTVTNFATAEFSVAVVAALEFVRGGAAAAGDAVVVCFRIPGATVAGRAAAAGGGTGDFGSAGGEGRRRK